MSIISIVDSVSNLNLDYTDRIMICCLFALFLINGNFLSIHGATTLQKSQLEQYQGVKYLAYTKTNKDQAVDVRDVNFDDGNTSVFVVHGFAAKDLDKPEKVKNDLFEYNSNVERVIIVDWRDYSGSNTYLKVAEQHVPRLAQDLYEKINHIRQNGAYGAVQLVGYSIGAHVAGQTGRLLQQNDKYTLDQIYGLDPTGEYFRDHTSIALQNGDAKNVVVLHTNINTYGFHSQIGPNDEKINGGAKQPNCKINVNKCSHYEAWNAFSRFLANKSANKSAKTATNTVNTDASGARMHPYVICLDVSSSMSGQKRLERARHAAQKTISNLKPGSYVGFVKFDGKAHKVHDIVELKGSSERESLRNAVPNTCGGYTSIGNGLRLSLDMLQAMPNSTSFCSTIVLISDGEENSSKYVKDVLPDFKNVCVKVSTIALGKDASKELENLSTLTGGAVAYSSEDGSGKDLVGTIKAFSYLFEGQTDKPVRLLSKDLKLSSSGEEIVQFTVDDTIGNETEFSIICHEIDKVDVKLTSPDGDVYLPTSEYFYENFAEKGFRIAFAEEGVWKLTVSRNSKSKRSARSSTEIDVTAQATSHERGSTPPILLNADVSHRVLVYPVPITIRAELKSGEFPILYSEAFADIIAPGQTPIRLPLYDDGIYPDDLAKDGIYTNNIVTLPNPERYSIIVTALSNGTAMSPQKEINYLLKDVIDCKKTQDCKTLGQFQREADVGAVKLASTAGLDKITPNPVSDLHGVIEDAAKQIISLEWTSPRNNGIQIKRYDIRFLVNGTDFEKGLEIEDSHVVNGSLNATKSTENEKISIQIPKNEWDIVVDKNLNEFQFSMKSIGHNGEISVISDIVSVTNGATGTMSKVTHHILWQFPVIVLLLLKLN